VKPLANGGIGDTETIPASTTPRLVFSPALAVLVLAPRLDPQLVPLCHRLRHTSSSIVLFPSALVDIPPVKIPTPTHCTPLSPSPKRSQHQARLVSTEGVCLRTSDVLVSPLFSLNGLSTILFLTLFPPRLPAVVALRFLSCLVVSSCALCRVFSPSPLSLPPPYVFHPVY